MIGAFFAIVGIITGVSFLIRLVYLLTGLTQKPEAGGRNLEYARRANLGRIELPKYTPKIPM